MRLRLLFQVFLMPHHTVPFRPDTLPDHQIRSRGQSECIQTKMRIRRSHTLFQTIENKTDSTFGAAAQHIPSERTVYRVMDQIGLSHRPKRKTNGITKADREDMKSDDLPKQDFCSDTLLEKCITGITEILASNGKPYVSAIFDCFDFSVLGLIMETNMKVDRCIHTWEKALTAYPESEGAVIHSDRGTQYSSESYRQTIREHHIH